MGLRKLESFFVSCTLLKAEAEAPDRAKVETADAYSRFQVLLDEFLLSLSILAVGFYRASSDSLELVFNSATQAEKL